MAKKDEIDYGFLEFDPEEKEKVKKELEEEKEKKKKPKVKLIISLICILLIISIIFIPNPVSDFFKKTYASISVEIKKTSSPFKDIFKFISHPEEKLGKIGEWKAETKAVEKEIPKGVIITDFKTKKPSYAPGEIIETTSMVEMYGMEKRDTKVKFGCGTTDKEGNIFISGEEGSEIDVYADSTEYNGVNCKLSDGFDAGEYKIKLKATYEDFASRGELKVYTLEKEELENLRERKIKPFNFYGINEPLLDATKETITSTYTYGPVKLTLGLNARQPIDEKGVYELYTKIEEDKSWKGKLSKIKSMKLILPDELEFSEDCILAKDMTGITLSEQGAEYWCKIRVKEVSEELTFTTIRLQVAYDYTFEKETAVKVEAKAISVTA